MNFSTNINQHFFIFTFLQLALLSDNTEINDDEFLTDYADDYASKSHEPITLLLLLTFRTSSSNSTDESLNISIDRYKTSNESRGSELLFIQVFYITYIVYIIFIISIF